MQKCARIWETPRESHISEKGAVNQLQKEENKKNLQGRIKKLKKEIGKGRSKGR